jgi:NADH:ubiquinone oxidoreductase subunit H
VGVVLAKQLVVFFVGVGSSVLVGSLTWILRSVEVALVVALLWVVAANVRLSRVMDFDWPALLVLSVFLIITSSFFSFGYGQSRKLSMPLAVSGMA